MNINSIKSLDTITSFDKMEIDENKCLNNFINNTPSSLEFIDMSSIQKMSSSGKKIIEKSILSIEQKNNFLMFLTNYKKITNSILTIVELNYYIKAYNKCYEIKVPMFDLKKFLFSKNQTLDELVLFNDYKQLIEIARSGRKELLPKRNALSTNNRKIMSKYINSNYYSQKAGDTNIITDEKEIINILREHIGDII